MMINVSSSLKLEIWAHVMMKDVLNMENWFGERISSEFNIQSPFYKGTKITIFSVEYSQCTKNQAPHAIYCINYIKFSSWLPFSSKNYLTCLMHDP